MEKQQNIINTINEIDELNEVEKKELISMVEKGDDPKDVLDAVEEKLQQKIDNNFDEAGIKLNENDPDYQAEYKKMTDGMETAKKEFDSEMGKIETEANQVADDAQKETDELKIQEIQDSINNN